MKMSNSTLNVTSQASTNNAYDYFVVNPKVDLFLISTNLLFGLPTHSYVIWLIVTGTKSGVASEFFILNLSVCEIGACLYSLLSLIIYFTKLLHLIRVTWLFLGLLVTARPLFHCLMCVERYLAVVHPVTFLTYKPLRYRLICCTAAWIITLGSCFCCMFATDQFQFCAYFLSLQFFVFLSIQLFCLVAVLRALKQSGPGERKKEKDHIKRRAFHLILITTITMSVIYIPPIISGFCFVLTQLFIVEMFAFGFVCFILGGFVQPVLYLQRAGKLPYRCFP